MLCDGVVVRYALMSTSQHNNTTTSFLNITPQHINLFLVINLHEHWVVVAWYAECHLAELELRRSLVALLVIGRSIVGPVHIGEHTVAVDIELR